MPFKLFKKAWDRVASTFELQEYGVGGGKGWSSLTEPTATPITKAEASQYYKPNSHYRVIARAIEGDHAGQFIGIVWEYFEPHKGLTPTAKEPKEPAQKQPKDAAEVMDAYVTEVDRVLTPILKLNETLAKIRDTFAPQGGPAAAPGEEDGEDGKSYIIPPPEFDGKLPALMHPYVMHMIAEEVKSIIDFGAKRMEQVFGGGGLPSKPEEEEKEESLLPSISKYRTQAPEPPAAPLSSETIEVTETEEGAPLLPEMPKPTETPTTTETVTEIPGLGPQSPQPPSEYYKTIEEKKEKKTTRRKTK